MFFVTDNESFKKAMEFINENEYLAFDTETTGLNVRKDSVIGFGVANSVSGFYVPIYKYDVSQGRLISIQDDDKISAILLSLIGKKLIMFNASFDARVTKNNLKVDLLPSLHADAMLLKHTCDEEYPFGLKEIATKLWGADAKQEKIRMQESIKSNGGRATEYYKADLSLLGSYCVQDAMLTMRIFEHYSVELRRQNLEQFFYMDEVMPLYKEVVIPMETVGIQVNVPLMQQTLEEAKLQLEYLEEKIQSAIAPSLQKFEQWFLNKEYPLKTEKGNLPLWAKQGLTQRQAFERDFPNQYMFNLQSKHHLKKLFFDTMGLEPLSRTPTGLPQVDEDFLEHIKTQVAWVPNLITFNKLNKLKSTYMEGILNETENSRFYPYFKLHGTVSGRLSSDIQQLPRPIEGEGPVVYFTNRIREFIVAKQGHRLLSADYNQLEPTIFSHTSCDDGLQSIFKDGKDFYSEIAIRTEGLEGISSDKKAENYLGKVNKAARQKAKAYSLGIPYGLTGYKLQYELNIPLPVAEQLVLDYLNAFPKLKEWIADSHKQALQTGCVRSQAGRVRHLPTIQRLYRKYGNAITNDLELWKLFNNTPDLYMQAKKDRKVFKNELNNSINFQVQSLAASVMNRASINIMRILKEKSMKSILVLNCHDELVFEVPEDEVQELSRLVKYEMENVVKLAVPLVTEPMIGNTYKECK